MGDIVNNNNNKRKNVSKATMILIDQFDIYS